MTVTKKDLIAYRLKRAWETYDDAEILAEKEKWNSTINRLYYSAYYAISALLLLNDLNPTTHKGVKSNFTEHFIKKGLIPKEYGKTYSQLFTWRQKGDYDDLFDFERDNVSLYFDPVKNLIQLIEKRVTELD
jgi:uncharacterized protein (UPF0332 family)